jgi:hypothetical protein
MPTRRADRRRLVQGFEEILAVSALEEVPVQRVCPGLPSDVQRTLKWNASDGFRLGARRGVLLGLFLFQQLL